MSILSFVRKDLALCMVFFFLCTSFYSCGGKGGGGGTLAAAPQLAPLPGVTDQDTVTVRGQAGLTDATVTVLVGAQEVSVATSVGTDMFQIPVDLQTGQNQVEVYATSNGSSTASTTVQITYALPTLTLDTISPGTGQSGSILDLTGTGFTADREVMGAYFRGLEQEGEGFVIEATETTLRVVVPFVFLDADEELEVYVFDESQVSNTAAFTVQPAQDPTALVAGNETTEAFGLLTTGTGYLLTKAEQLLEPLLTPEEWGPVEENLTRIGVFLDAAEDEILAVNDEAALSQLDSIFGSDIVGHLLAQLDLVNDILSHSDWVEAACNGNDAVAVLRDVRFALEVVEVLVYIGLGVCFFVCQGVLPVLEIIREIVDVVLDILDAIIGIFEILPTRPSPTSWRVDVVGPYPGLDPQLMYTDTESEMRLLVDYTNGEGKLVIGRVTSLGGIVLRLLDIDIPEIVEKELLTPSTVILNSVSPPDWFDTAQTFPGLSFDISDGGEDTHLATTYPAVFSSSFQGTANLDIYGSCGPFSYPDEVCLAVNEFEEFEACQDEENVPEYEDPWHVDVIEAPIVDDVSWDSEYSAWYVTGMGFSTDCGTTFKVFYNGEEIDCACLQGLDWDSFWAGCRQFDQPGWLDIMIVDPSDPDNQDLWREGTSEYIPPNPLDDVEIKWTLPDSGFIGDVISVIGESFTPSPDDMFLTFYDDQGVEIVTIHPIDVNSIWLDRSEDTLTFAIPEELHGLEGQTISFRVKVGIEEGYGNTYDYGDLGLRPAESAQWGDQDLIVFDEEEDHMRSAAVGDLDGDGENDLVVGIPEDRFQGYAIGKVVIAFGPVEGVELPTGQEYIDIDYGNPADRDWDVLIVGDMTDSFGSGSPSYDGNSRRIGNSLAIGDVNGDDIDDLLIGTTDQNDEDLHQYNLETRFPSHLPGEAYLFYGQDRAVWMSNTGVFYIHYENPITHHLREEYDVKILGDNERELGYQVALGDFNDDNYADMVIGAPSDVVIPGATNDTLAKTYVVFGAASLPRDIDVTSIPVTVSGVVLTDIADAWQTPPSGGDDYLGTGLGKEIAVGDINGDGVDDLLVGAPQFSDNDISYLRQGAAYIFYGGTGFGGDGTLDVGLWTGEQDVHLLGLPDMTQTAEGIPIGRPLAIGDLNGDGHGEIILGSPYSPIFYQYGPAFQFTLTVDDEQVGRVIVADGSTIPSSGEVGTEDLTDLVIWGSPSINRFGMDVATADIDGDGIGDLLVGAPGRQDNPNPGSIWGLFGSDQAGSLWGTIHLTDRSGDPDDFIIRGDQGHAGHYNNQGFGTFITAGDLSPYIGDDVIAIDPLADAPDTPDPREYAGMLYVFYEGSSILRHIPFGEGLSLDETVSGLLEGEGDQDAWDWICEGELVLVDVDETDSGGSVLDFNPDSAGIRLYDEHQAVYAEGFGDLINVQTPDTGQCGLLITNISTGSLYYDLIVSAAGSAPLALEPASAVMAPCDSSGIFSVTGGVWPYTFSFVEDPVPAEVGLTDLENGTAWVDVTECLTQGTVLNLKVVDGEDTEATAEITFSSGTSDLAIEPESTVLWSGDVYEHFYASGGTPAYAFTLAGSTIPAGLQLIDYGDGHAFLTADGPVDPSPFFVRVEDSTGATADAAVYME